DDRPPDPVLLVLAKELLGLVRARPDLRKLCRRAKILGVLEPLPGLGAALKRVAARAVDHPPVAVRLADHARRAVPETLVHALRPEIGRLDDVRIRGDERPVEHRCLHASLLVSATAP